MITADKVKTLIEFGPKGLAVILDKSGYHGASFKTAQFVGITNGGQFAYKVTYFDKENTGKDQVGKVFITYNFETDSIVADY
jgi:hypothetical protein